MQSSGHLENESFLRQIKESNIASQTLSQILEQIHLEKDKVKKEEMKKLYFDDVKNHLTVIKMLDNTVDELAKTYNLINNKLITLKAIIENVKILKNDTRIQKNFAKIQALYPKLEQILEAKQDPITYLLEIGISQSLASKQSAEDLNVDLTLVKETSVKKNKQDQEEFAKKVKFYDSIKEILKKYTEVNLTFIKNQKQVFSNFEMQYITEGEQLIFLKKIENNISLFMKLNVELQAIDSEQDKDKKEIMKQNITEQIIACEAAIQNITPNLEHFAKIAHKIYKSVVHHQFANIPIQESNFKICYEGLTRNNRHNGFLNAFNKIKREVEKYNKSKKSLIAILSHRTDLIETVAISNWENLTIVQKKTQLEENKQGL